LPTSGHSKEVFQNLLISSRYLVFQQVNPVFFHSVPHLSLRLGSIFIIYLITRHS